MTYKIRGILVHHTASDGFSTTIEDVTKWHQAKGWATIGYNYLIEWDGGIKAGRAEGVVTSGAKGYNRGYLHICVTGNTMELPITAEQSESLDLLLCQMVDKYNLTRDHVIGHREAPKASTLCPGDGLMEWLNSWRTND